MSEFEIALLFPLCVASFAAFLFALSPRLYCEGVEIGGEMGDIISSKIKDPYGEDGESERFFCLWCEINLLLGVNRSLFFVAKNLASPPEIFF